MTAKELQKRNHKAENLRVLQTEDGQFFCGIRKGKNPLSSDPYRR